MHCFGKVALAAVAAVAVAAPAGAASLNLALDGVFAYDPAGGLSNAALSETVSTLITGTFGADLDTTDFDAVLPYTLTVNGEIEGLGSDSLGPLLLGSFSFSGALTAIASEPLFGDLIDLIGDIIDNPVGGVVVPDNQFTPSFELLYAFTLIGLDDDLPGLSAEIGFVFGIPDDIGPFLRNEVGVGFPERAFKADFAADLVIEPAVAPIPLPAGALLLPAALGALALLRRRAA